MLIKKDKNKVNKHGSKLSICVRVLIEPLYQSFFWFIGSGSLCKAAFLNDLKYCMYKFWNPCLQTALSDFELADNSMDRNHEGLSFSFYALHCLGIPCSCFIIAVLQIIPLNCFLQTQWLIRKCTWKRK